MPTRRFDLAAGLVVTGLGAAIAALALFGGPRPIAVVAVSPADRATDVPTGAQVVVTFNRPLDPATARAGLVVSPYVEGFVSAAGRRLAFTPRAGFRADTDYTVTVGPGVTDRGGRALEAPVVFRFRTRPQTLVLRTVDGRLIGARQEVDGVGTGTPLAERAGAVFAVGPAGDVAYVSSGALVVADDRGRVRRRVPLPEDARLVALAWVAEGATLVELASFAGGGTVGLQIRLDVEASAAVPLGPSLGPAERYAGVEAAKLRLARAAAGGEGLAAMPDGQSVILRDEDLAYAVFGLDGARRRRFGAFLALGGPSPSGEAAVFVDVDPADPALARRVLLFERTGRLRLLSPPERDAHDPAFARRHERVVFASGPAEGPLGRRRYALELLDLATGVQRRLTSPPPGFTDGEPRWSPDDAWILFRRGPAGRPEDGAAWIVPADGAAQARPLGERIVDARWSP
jgi:hypothetical protein